MVRNFSSPQSILITGASSGIGAALAIGYAGPGVFLALGGRNMERLETVARQCRERGAKATVKAIEVVDRAAMAAWIDGVDAAHPLDLVIANAGISAGTAQSADPTEKIREIFAVNVDGLLNTIDPAIARMRPRRRGQLALVSSIAGFRGMPRNPAYSASKAAVRSFGEGLRGFLWESGIGVSVICPGFVVSGMTAVNTFPMPFIMGADKAAAIIRRGLARDKARIAFPLPMYFIVWLMSVLPPAWTDPLVRRVPRDA
ncbi:MAG: SDR family NAD(P)-dependent oxidoreductase [Rhodospirillales bacterium]|jgi:short-subunit dehydrogenase|nr:SDR family NAD(P)-dependent oxidoreductase [Rhodospirillales bacterium]